MQALDRTTAAVRQFSRTASAIVKNSLVVEGDVAATISPRKRSPIDVVLTKNGVVLVAVYLYFCGWAYTYLYYHRFGIASQALETPFYTVFVFAFTVAFDPKNALFVVLVMLTWILIEHISAKWLHLARTFALTIMLVAAFPLIWLFAKRSADLNAAKIDTRPPLEFTFSDDTAMPPALLSANRSRQLRLMLETATTVYAVEASGKSLYAIAKSNIRAVTLYP